MEGKRSIEFIVISSASTLSLPPQHTFPLALHRRRQCCRRATQDGGLNCSTARAGGRWDGAVVRPGPPHRSFGISPGDGGGGGSEVLLLLLRLRSRLISAAAASLSLCLGAHMRAFVVGEERSRSFVRSFSISFGLSALFVFNCSILFFLPPPLNLLLPPSSLSSPHTSSLAVRGPSEAGAGAGTAVSAVVPEDALDAAIHDVCVFRHYQVNADADRKFECAVRNEIGESLKLDYFGENAERENDGRGRVGPRPALVRFISSEESGQREPTAWPQSAKSARNSRFLSLLRELPICRDVIPQRQRGRRTTTNVISLLGSDGESGKSAGARKPLKAS